MYRSTTLSCGNLWVHLGPVWNCFHPLPHWHQVVIWHPSERRPLCQRQERADCSASLALTFIYLSPFDPIMPPIHSYDNRPWMAWMADAIYNPFSRGGEAKTEKMCPLLCQVGSSWRGRRSSSLPPLSFSPSRLCLLLTLAFPVCWSQSRSTALHFTHPTDKLLKCFLSSKSKWACVWERKQGTREP